MLQLPTQNRTNGVAFFLLIASYLRSLGITTTLAWQRDWGEEFGGSNPHRLLLLQRKYFDPLHARLVKIPKGCKQYNGRVERSHRTDDEEFYLPLLLSIHSENDLLHYAAAWVFYYNTSRPHYGYHMDGLSPLQRLRKLHYTSFTRSNLFPPIILDDIACKLVIQDGNDLLAHYSSWFTASFQAFRYQCLR